jgi:ketosteroid isomerase-like protein
VRVGPVFGMLLAAALLAPRPAVAQPHTANTKAVQAAVEHFLDVLGKRDLDALPALMAPKATMAVLRQREGQWTTTIQTFDEWLGALRSQTTATPFREPLTKVSVNVEDGRLAFLRADFTVVIDGEVRAHGIDYFTLVKDGEAWKILNGSYTNHPGAPKPTK